MKVTLAELKQMIKEQMRRQSMVSRETQVKMNAISKIEELLQALLDELAEFRGGADDRDVAEFQEHVKVLVKLLAKIAGRSGLKVGDIPRTFSPAKLTRR